MTFWNSISDRIGSSSRTASSITFRPSSGSKGSESAASPLLAVICRYLARAKSITAGWASDFVGVGPAWHASVPPPAAMIGLSATERPSSGASISRRLFESLLMRNISSGSMSTPMASCCSASTRLLVASSKPFSPPTTE